MDKIWVELRYWGQILLLPVYALSFLFPRSKRIWVFGSTFGCRFADNPKYFYLYVNQMKAQEIRAIWISKNEEVVRLLKENRLEAYHINSLKGQWFSLRAKVYIFDNYSKDICFWLSGGAAKVNLWHGIPLKKINMDNKMDSVRYPGSRWKKLKYVLRRISDEKPSHYVLTTSKYFVPIFSSAFKTNRVLNCGYPRNDIFTASDIHNLLTHREAEKLDEILARKCALKAVRVALYMPTFRDSEKDLFTILDGKELNDFLHGENILLCIKPHPKSKVIHKYKGLSSANIIMIDAEADPYVYLEHIDLLITDYSSIYFDYLLLDRPIIFFCYDMDKYLASSRELYFEYDEFTPGVKAQSIDELKYAMANVESISNNEQIKMERAKIGRLAFDHGNVSASEKLYQRIFDQLNRICRKGDQDVSKA